MSSLSQLVLMHSDPRAAAALSFGFEREGTKVVVKDNAEGLEQALVDGGQLLIAGGGTKEEAKKLLAMAQGVMMGSGKRVPVMYFGNAISREVAMADGANEFVAQPAYIRDVVTLAKLMATPTARRTQSISGELGEHFGLYYIVRALGTINNTGVLSLIRGLRRGELRFYKGELTSAQLGALHGLSALHQLLLWTNARFDLREERVVHRRQIPLSRPELLSDCERFLSEIQSIADGLSPSAVLERDPEKDASDLPKQVAQVLSLFDGKDSVADVIEDSPFRVFETLRIACRLTEQGFIRRSNQAAPTHLMHTALAIEEWLVGGEVNPGASSNANRPRGPKVAVPSETASKGSPSGGKKRARTDLSQPVKKPAATAKETPARNEQSWSDVLPSRHTTEELAQVVPATAAAGEISMPPSSRAAARLDDAGLPKAPTRERLEEKGGVESLNKIFIDESLGPVVTETKLTPHPAPADPSANSSWDDITSPAKSLVDPSAAAAIEEGRRLAKEILAAEAQAAGQGKATAAEVDKDQSAIPKVVDGFDTTPKMTIKASDTQTPAGTPRAKLEVKSTQAKDAEVEQATAKTEKAAGAKVEAIAAAKTEKAAAAKVEKAAKSDKAEEAKAVATEAKAETAADAKSEKAADAKAEKAADAKAEKAADAKAEKASEANAEKAADAKSDKAASASETKSKFKDKPAEEPSAQDNMTKSSQANVARDAHAKVAETAKDAVEVASALLAIANQAKPKRKARKRHNSKSDIDAAAVQAVVKAAGAASSQVTDFSADEEAFFSRGVAEEKAPVIPAENFEDLDEDYEIPKTFWQRFMSDPTKAKRKKK